ncbi:MAG TPA: alpha/beta hydrolase [Leptolyngbyaceae cyanobacterium M65_K2018_010]|nr:alpha/beta hydrolase [Leptolyngbyaceae cyanobacterium M65_K2018_010]
MALIYPWLHGQTAIPRRLWRWGLLALMGLGAVLSATPGQTAEEIIISFGLLERTVAIGDLEQFAKTGQLTPQLQSYNRLLGLSADQLAQFRQVLITPAETLSHVAIAQFFYTEQGEILLNELVQVVRTPARQGDFFALRAALILGAAYAEDGVTLLDVLKAYPMEAIRIDLAGGFAIAQAVNRAIFQSEQAVALVQDLAQQEAAAAPMDAGAFADLLQLLQENRRYGVQRVNLVVPGLTRPVALYLPQVLGEQRSPSQGFPLVIISHGLGGTRESYAYLANFLATGGVAVAAIEHTGSNAQQLMALLEGLTDAVVADDEFIRRPQDVSQVISALKRTQTPRLTLPVRLDMDRIGVVGQSFGGYTALALAGATFDQAKLEEFCPPSQISLNPSLLLQCQAVRLGDPGGRLADPRVRSIFVMNPIGSVVFGESGYGLITVPTMVVAGTADTVSPAFPEQIQPFTWLTTPERFLLLLNQGTHFSVIGDVAQAEPPLALPPALIGPRPDLAQSYMQILALAFFQLTLNQDERYRPMVQAAFAEKLSAEALPMDLTRTLSAADLQEALR